MKHIHDRVRTARLRHKITIQERSTNKASWEDADGEGVWKDVAECRAEVKPIFGYHAITGAGLAGMPLEERAFYQITLRFRDDIDVGMRVRFGKRPPLIIKRVIDKEERRQALTLLAEHEKPGKKKEESHEPCAE